MLDAKIPCLAYQGDVFTGAVGLYLAEKGFEALIDRERVDRVCLRGAHHNRRVLRRSRRRRSIRYENNNHSDPEGWACERQADVRELLRAVSRPAGKRQWALCRRAEGPARRPDPVEQEQRRQVSGSSRCERSSIWSEDSCARFIGYADLGNFPW